jgi:hypothetical protein
MSGLRPTSWALSFVLVCGACGGASKGAAPPDGGSGDDGSVGSQDVPVTPQKEGPAKLSPAEKAELGGKCAPIEPDLYDAGKAGVAALETELLNGTASDAADKKGVDAALGHMKGKNGGMGAPDVERCLVLFGKQMKRRLFDFEPYENEARMTVDSCVKRAVKAFGKESTVIDYGGAGDAASHGPFCPDDFPVPESLSDLPYKSSSDDWDTPAWKCLQFGLRVEQNYQVEYASARGSNEFVCITRFLPRQGGAPIELMRGGKMNDEGELLVGEKLQRRRMNK